MKLHYGDPFTLTSIYGDFLEIKTDKKPPSQYIDGSTKQLSFTSKKNDFLCMFISASDIENGEEILYNAQLHICIYGYPDEIGYYSDKKDNRPLYFFDKDAVLKATKDKSDYNCTFNIKPELVDDIPSKGETYPVLYTDVISIAGDSHYTKTSNCGWWGCRVMRTYDDNKDYPVSFVHGDKPSPFPTFTIYANANNEQPENDDSSNNTFSESDNIHCTCATGSKINDSAQSNISYDKETENSIVDKTTVEETYKIGYKEEFNAGCVPDVGCIPETCYEEVCVDECTPKVCTDPCGGLWGGCKTCIPEVCTGKICTTDFIPNCSPKVCTDDLCAQAGIEFTNSVKLHFDYEIINITKELADILTGTISYTYEQKIILTNMYFKGKILYEETASNLATVSYSVELTIDVKNPTALYCRNALEPTKTTFACGGCILLTDEKLDIEATVKLGGEDIGFEMSIGQPTIGVCATTSSSPGSTGTYYNLSASVYTKMIIPGVPDPVLTANVVYSQKLA
jgi:hypothetical protein